jgi:hypothetical protein
MPSCAETAAQRDVREAPRGGLHRQAVAEKAAGDQPETAQQSAEQRRIDDTKRGDNSSLPDWCCRVAQQDHVSEIAFQEKTIAETRHPARLSQMRVVHQLCAIRIRRGIKRQDELCGDAPGNTCGIGLEQAKMTRTSVS